MKVICRLPWTTLAILFLAISWIWEAIAPIVQAVIDALPLRTIKAWTRRVLDRLPPYPTLLVFAIPLTLSEVVKIGSYVALAHKLFVLGAMLYIAAEVVRFGLAAYVWSVCRDKLLSIPWVAKLHGWLLRLHSWARAQTEPVRAWIQQALSEAGLVNGEAGMSSRIRALWRHARRKTA